MFHNINRFVVFSFVFLAERITITRLYLLWAFSATIFCNSIFTFKYFPSIIPITITGRFFFYFLLLFSGCLFLIKTNRFYFDRYIGLILLYLASSLLSIIVNHSQIIETASINSFFGMVLPATVALFFVQIFSITDIERIAKTFVLFGIINIFIVSSYIYSYDPLHREFLGGIFGDPNLLARFLCICLSYLMLKALISNSQKRILCIAVSLLIVFCITFLFSRSGYILTFFQLIHFVIWANSKKIWRLFIIGGPIVLIVFSIMFMNRINKDNMKVANMSDLGRVSLLKAGLNMIKTNPIFGIGYGMSSQRYKEFQDKKFPGLVAVDTIHNAYVHVFAEQGIIGIAIYLAFNFGLLFSLFKKAYYEKNKSLRMPSLFCFFSLSSFLIHILMFPLPDYEGVYWIIIAASIIALKPAQFQIEKPM